MYMDKSEDKPIQDDALHVWVITLVLFAVYVSNALSVFVLLIWRRNKQPLKVRSVVMHVTLIIGDLLGGLVLLLRIVIGRRRFPCFLYIGGAYILAPIALTPRVFRIWRVYVIFKLNQLKNKALMVEWRERHRTGKRRSQSLHIEDVKERFKRWSGNFDSIEDVDEGAYEWDSASQEKGHVMRDDGGSGDGDGRDDGNGNDRAGSGMDSRDGRSYVPLFTAGDDGESEKEVDQEEAEFKIAGQGQYMVNISSKIDAALVTLSSRKRFILALKLSAHIGTMFVLILILQLLSTAFNVITTVIRYGTLSYLFSTDGCHAKIEFLVLISILVLSHGLLMIILAILCRRIHESYGLTRETIISTVFLAIMISAYTVVTVLDVAVGHVDTDIFSASWFLAIMVLIDSWIIRWVPIINTFRRRYNTPISPIVDSGKTSLSTLYSILNHEISSKHFYMYAETEFSSENISFYHDVKFYRSLLLDKFDYREKIKRYILATYFQRGSPLELNIPSEIRQLYIEKLHELKGSKNMKTRQSATMDDAVKSITLGDNEQDEADTMYEDMDQQQSLFTSTGDKSGSDADFFTLAMRHVELNMIDTLSRFQMSELYRAMIKQHSEFQSDLKNFNMF